MRPRELHDAGEEELSLLDGFWARWSGTLEGWIFLSGLLLFALLFLEFSVLFALAPDIAAAEASAVGAEMFTGREGGIPVAVQGGVPRWLIVQVSVTQDIAMACLAYPAFVYLLHRFHDRDNMVMRRLRRVESAAERHQAFTEKWGPWGVFLFMLVPFLINGPLAGAVLGRLAGIHTRKLILPVVASTAIAAVAWTYAYDRLFHYVGRLDDRLPLAITALILSFLVMLMFIDEWRARRRARAAAHE